MPHMTLQGRRIGAAVSGQAAEQEPRLAKLQAMEPSGNSMKQKPLRGWRQFEGRLLHAFLLWPLLGTAPSAAPIASICRFRAAAALPRRAVRRRCQCACH
jgi:hypothetical protein